MSKFFTTLTFTFFLLFQTTALAEEEMDMQEQTIVEDVPENIPTEALALEESTNETKEPTEKQEQEPNENIVEETEEVSEAQREAQAAEEAELREAGVGEEPEAE
jgi:hypothetical protein